MSRQAFLFLGSATGGRFKDSATKILAKFHFNQVPKPEMTCPPIIPLRTGVKAPIPIPTAPAAVPVVHVANAMLRSQASVKGTGELAWRFVP